MSAALALAILLVVVVGVLSLAVNAQGPVAGGKTGPGATRPQTSGHPGSTSSAPRTARRPARDRGERQERGERKGERQAGASTPGGGGGSSPLDDPTLFADVKPLNSQAQALVISVVDERTLGPVTRSRLTLRVEPSAGEPFEVTTRVAFPTPEERAKVKVGAMIPVRYDSDDHRRVVVETEGETPA